VTPALYYTCLARAEELERFAAAEGDGTTGQSGAAADGAEEPGDVAAVAPVLRLVPAAGAAPSPTAEARPAPHGTVTPPRGTPTVAPSLPASRRASGPQAPGPAPSPAVAPASAAGAASAHATRSASPASDAGSDVGTAAVSSSGSTKPLRTRRSRFSMAAEPGTGDGDRDAPPAGVAASGRRDRSVDAPHSPTRSRVSRFTKSPAVPSPAEATAAATSTQSAGGAADASAVNVVVSPSSALLPAPAVATRGAGDGGDGSVPSGEGPAGREPVAAAASPRPREDIDHPWIVAVREAVRGLKPIVTRPLDSSFPAATTGRVLYCGWLQVQEKSLFGGFKWVRRWCVLLPRTIGIYTADPRTKGVALDDPPARCGRTGGIVLDSTVVFADAAAATASGGGSSARALVTVDPTFEVYYPASEAAVGLRAATFADLGRWMAMLQCTSAVLDRTALARVTAEAAGAALPVSNFNGGSISVRGGQPVTGPLVMPSRSHGVVGAIPEEPARARGGVDSDDDDYPPAQAGAATSTARSAALGEAPTPALPAVADLMNLNALADVEDDDDAAGAGGSMSGASTGRPPLHGSPQIAEAGRPVSTGPQRRRTSGAGAGIAEAASSLPTTGPVRSKRPSLGGGTATAALLGGGAVGDATASASSSTHLPLPAPAPAPAAAIGVAALAATAAASARASPVSAPAPAAAPAPAPAVAGVAAGAPARASPAGSPATAPAHAAAPAGSPATAPAHAAHAGSPGTAPAHAAAPAGSPGTVPAHAAAPAGSPATAVAPAAAAPAPAASLRTLSRPLPAQPPPARTAAASTTAVAKPVGPALPLLATVTPSTSAAAPAAAGQAPAERSSPAATPTPTASSGGRPPWRLFYGNEASMTSVWVDLGRTFPDLAFFSEGSEMREQLHRLLTAYALARPDHGYVQGMSHIAAILLLTVGQAVDDAGAAEGLPAGGTPRVERRAASSADLLPRSHSWVSAASGGSALDEAAKAGLRSPPVPLVAHAKAAREGVVEVYGGKTDDSAPATGGHGSADAGVATAPSTAPAAATAASAGGGVATVAAAEEAPVEVFIPKSFLSKSAAAPASGSAATPATPAVAAGWGSLFSFFGGPAAPATGGGAAATSATAAAPASAAAPSAGAGGGGGGAATVSTSATTLAASGHGHAHGQAHGDEGEVIRHFRPRLTVEVATFTAFANLLSRAPLRWMAGRCATRRGEGGGGPPARPLPQIIAPPHAGTWSAWRRGWSCTTRC
jgi:hypothetical protein